MLFSTPNGCTCAPVRAMAKPDDPMPADWRCVSCRGRAKLPDRCSSCGVGIYSDEVQRQRLCANCQEDRGLY